MPDSATEIALLVVGIILVIPAVIHLFWQQRRMFYRRKGIGNEVNATYGGMWRNWFFEEGVGCVAWIVALIGIILIYFAFYSNYYYETLG